MIFFWIALIVLTIMNLTFAGVAARSADRTEALIENFAANVDGKIQRRIETAVIDVRIDDKSYEAKMKVIGTKIDKSA